MTSIRFSSFFIILSLWVVSSFAGDNKGTPKEEIQPFLKESLDVTRTLPFSGKMVFHRKNAKHDWNTRTKVIRFPNGEKDMIFEAPEMIAGMVLINDMEGLWGTQVNKEKEDKIQNDENVDRELIERVFAKRNVLNLLELENLDLIWKNYTFTFEPNEYVAGREARKISIRCNFSCRPSFTVWIDKETKMQLKYQRSTTSGEFMEEFFFETIDLKPDFEKFEKISRDTLHKFFSYEEEQPKKITPDFTPLDSCFLPQGFMKKDVNSWTGDKGQVLYTLYTDGLAYISIFQRKQTEQEKKEQAEKKICPQDIRRIERRGKFVYYRETEGLRVSILGDVSCDELVKTLSGFKPAKK